MAFLMKLSLWALAFVPLVVNSSVFFPFIFGKTLMIRICISLVSLLFTVHLFANKEFRSEMYGKLKRVARNPLFISFTAFIAIFAVSTIFAVNPFRAFFGDVERGEGLLGFLYFYGFFIYSLMLFEKKDWIWFFKLNLVTGLILFIKELFELCPTSDAGVTTCSWGSRPGSFTGNPEFLAGYFLFIFFAALVSYYYSKKYKEIFWNIFAAVMVPVSLVGLFITQTRGAMLGFVAGLLMLVVYGFFHGKSVIAKKGVSLRAASMWLLIAMVAIGGIFLITKANPVWQKIPGFSRAANFSFNDNSVQTRLISLGVSKNAIDPAKNGMEKFLIGWGPENFSTAYNEYYNPEYYHLEHTWFDRAHNKLMDVGVMNGILGLLAYLCVWASIIWLVFRRKGFVFDMMSISFFGIAFFINLLFLFDQISTVIPLFSFFAFVVYISALEDRQGHTEHKSTANGNKLTIRDYACYGIASGSAVFFAWGLIVWTVVPMSQMNNYLSAISSQDVGSIIEHPEAVFEPYTFAQQDIRNHFLSIAMANYGNKQLQPVFDLAINEMKDMLQREPNGPRFLLMLAGAYDRMGKADGNMEDFKTAEEYYKRALALAPQRQDVVYAYALNLSYQGRAADALALIRKERAVDAFSPETHYYFGIMLAAAGGDYREVLPELESALSSPTFANARDEYTRNIYRTMLRSAYLDRNKEAFVTISNRLIIIDPDQAEKVKRMEAIVETGKWPSIDFQR